MESQIVFFSQHTMTKLHATILFFLVLSNKHFNTISHDVHVYTLHLYKIH
jgi:hypothetical protein